MSYIEIGFNYPFASITNLDTWEFDFHPDNQPGDSTSFSTQFLTTRTANYQITNNVNFSTLLNNILTAMNIDLPLVNNGSDLTLATRNDATYFYVVVTGVEYQFTSVNVPAGSVVNVSNDPEVTPQFELLTVSFSQAVSSPCSNVRATVTQQNGVSPFEWITPAAGQSGLIADIPRGSGDTTITIQDDNLDIAGIQVEVPQLFTTANINTIETVTNPSGIDATVTVFMQNLGSLTVEFSIDGVNYQSSNIFPSMTDGSYTLYIQDQYGCVVTQAFDVDIAASIQLPPPYYYFPESNSFRFIQLQASINNTSVLFKYDNILNNNYTLERFNNPPYCQPWSQVDTVTTQFRTNYDTPDAVLLDENGNVFQNLTTTKVSNNLGLNETGDLFIYDRGDGQTGVYFGDGNLKTWSTVGQNFTLLNTATNGTFQIKQTLFDSAVNAQVMVIDRLYTDSGTPTSGNYDVTYDKVNYEEWEFEVNLGIVAGHYQVRVTLTDSDYDQESFFSEPLEVINDDRLKDLNYLEWSVRPDDGINYDTGIVHKQRFQSLALRVRHSLSSTVYTDSKKRLNKIDGSVQRNWKVDVIDVPDWVVEKLQQACSMELIKLNGVEVQTEEGFAEPDETQQYHRNVVTSGTFQVVNYDQAFTDEFDINGERGLLKVEGGFLKVTK